MTDRFQPDTDDQVRELVAWAAAEEEPLEVAGAGTKRGLGRPPQTGKTLDLSALAGISLYEPEELVLSAGAGTPLADIAAAIAENGQQLAFEPPDLGPLFGQAAGAQTIGGVVAANLAGSRRISAGAARDHFLGVTAVTGRGDLIKSGGRVVKNVTGYDLCKVLAGSHGTLAAMTEIIVKVLPRGDKTRTVLAIGLDDEAARALMSDALGSANEVSGAAHLPAVVAARSAVSYVAKAGAPVTALRVEGPGPSVDHRCRALRALVGSRAVAEELHSHNSHAFWKEVTDAAAFAADHESAIWRLSVAPTAAPNVAAALRAGGATAYFYDWGGGLIWAAAPPAGDALAAAVRAAVAIAGGHATLIRAPEAVRAAVDVFEPQDDGLAALTRRLKESFDPQAVLNPGRMYAGV